MNKEVRLTIGLYKMGYIYSEIKRMLIKAGFPRRHHTTIADRCKKECNINLRNSHVGLLFFNNYILKRADHNELEDPIKFGRDLRAKFIIAYGVLPEEAKSKFFSTF